jgi:signal peptidase II
VRGPVRRQLDGQHHAVIGREIPNHSAPPTEGESRRLRVVIFGLAALILVLDQVTKLWAVSALSRGRSISVIGDLLELRLLYNPGAAFSLGTGFTWVFTIVAAVFVVAIAVVAWRVRSPGWSLGLGLVLGGASTHLLDRLFRAPAFGRGHVVDFIDYAGFFVGNVADIAIVTGAVVLALLNLQGIAFDGRRPSSERT